jgi:hypothetical protein
MGVLSSWSAKARLALNPQGDPEPPEPDADAEAGGVARMRWAELCRCEAYRGLWVALDECRYDEATGEAAEGSVVDADADLVELCARIRASERKNCAILFCADQGSDEG